MSTVKPTSTDSSHSDSSTVKHTPGPWSLETVRTSVGVCHQIGPLGCSTKLKSACLYDDCYSDRARDLQLLADARLIAAAPELLEALKEAAKYVVFAGNDHPVMHQIVAAISKAERGQ